MTAEQQRRFRGGSMTITPLRTIGDIVASSDLASEIASSAATEGVSLAAGDVVVISSKVVSKAEGLVHPAMLREELVAARGGEPVAVRRTADSTTVIGRMRRGPTLAAAGVDASNTRSGTVLVLPQDPDGSARRLRRELHACTGLWLAVVITDTAGRPWRDGQTDFALGVAGLWVVDDLRGSTDKYGNVLNVTVRAVADEIAAAADLVKGKLDGVPVAIARGLAQFTTTDDGPGALRLIRGADEDWFRYGHVEAVRVALGVDDLAAFAPSTGPESIHIRIARAWDVAKHDIVELTQMRMEVVEMRATCEVAMSGDLFRLGILVQRLLTALWSEGLSGSIIKAPATRADAAWQLEISVKELDRVDFPMPHET